MGKSRKRKLSKDSITNDVNLSKNFDSNSEKKMEENGPGETPNHSQTPPGILKLAQMQMQMQLCETPMLSKPRHQFFPDPPVLDDLIGHYNLRSNAGGSGPEDLPPDFGFGKNMAGCEHLLEQVKTRILFPIANSSFMKRHERAPPRGIMLEGAPGTGKTLFAKCLAAELSRLQGKPYKFYVHRGAEILSSYVGESEKNLRQIFTLAKKTQPSIIFFDEIDAISSDRSTNDGNSHQVGLVCTLLAEIDKLYDNNSSPGKKPPLNNGTDVLILAATNRIGSVDPALLRPGRCDIILTFRPPTHEGRKQILKMYTKDWRDSAPSTGLLKQLASLTVGYTGADLNKLCSEAFFTCVARTLKITKITKNGATSPSSSSSSSFTTSIPKVTGDEHITPEDWLNALSKMKPSKSNVFGSAIQTLEVAEFALPLLSGVSKELSLILEGNIISTANIEDTDEKKQRKYKKSKYCETAQSDASITSISKSISKSKSSGGPNCHLFWHPAPNSAEIVDNLIIPAIFNQGELSSLPVFVLNEETMLEQDCSRSFTLTSLIKIIDEAKECDKPCFLFIPRIDVLSRRLGGGLGDADLLRKLLFDTGSKSVTVVATAGENVKSLPCEIQGLFDGYNRVHRIPRLKKRERREFFQPIFTHDKSHESNSSCDDDNAKLDFESGDHDRQPDSEDGEEDDESGNGNGEDQDDKFSDFSPTPSTSKMDSKDNEIDRKKSKISKSKSESEPSFKVSSTEKEEAKFERGLSELLDYTVEKTNHDDIFSMITLHRELYALCREFRGRKDKTKKLLGKMERIVKEYEKHHLVASASKNRK